VSGVGGITRSNFMNEKSSNKNLYNASKIIELNLENKMMGALASLARNRLVTYLPVGRDPEIKN
jgi:hypothetical protein